MRIDRLTSKLQIALSDAQSVALGRDHAYIDAVHLLVALFDQLVFRSQSFVTP